MQIRLLVLLSLATASFCVPAVAVEPAVASGAERAATAPSQKMPPHKKACVAKDGKTCPLHKQTKASAKQAPASPTPPVAAASAVAPAVIAAPAVTAPASASAAPAGKPVNALSDADGRKLAQKSGCFTCHAIEKKVVGPAWRAIAEKYRGDATAEARLIAKVSKGGSGAWGSLSMPANSPRVSDADIKSLVKYALSLK